MAMSGTGSIFPEEDCSLIMTNANVIFEVDNIESSNKIDLSFNGNYTIYNPDQSRNVTIAAPFSALFNDLEETLLIKVQNNVTPFRVIELHWSDPWNEYLDLIGLGMSNRRNFILCNITVPENSSVILEYSFDAYFTHTDSDGNLYVYYDVGTSRAWNGSITERVEFKTYGMLPDSYSINEPSFYNYSCTVSNYSNGKSYTWEWINETIMIDSVYIVYYYNYPYFWGRIAPFIIFGSIIGGSILIGVIIKSINRRKKKLRVEIRDKNSI